MGTNYYYYPLGKGICSCCKQEKPFIHIGKSSVSWAFMLHVEEKGPKSFKDWILLFDKPGSEIYDEYDDKVGVAQLVVDIGMRHRAVGDRPNNDFLDRNKAYIGVDNLLHSSDLKQEGGSWDLAPGEFS